MSFRNIAWICVASITLGGTAAMLDIQFFDGNAGASLMGKVDSREAEVRQIDFSSRKPEGFSDLPGDDQVKLREQVELIQELLDRRVGSN
ncbi:MAG: hypothetical protein HKN23_09765 [Verrucomicrobiales bacterium]|nr:hypothetical protein [Verrucomicrobiales bacterium]